MKALFPWTVGATIGLLSVPIAALSQSITPAEDGTGTVVNRTGNQYDISEGTPSDTNLFHSFQQLGLNEGEIANFLSNPDIENILGRVIGGNASLIDGLIKVSGRDGNRSDANLFLMNPAGIIFGENAQLNVPADFTATTANAIGIGEDWFSSLGTNDYGNLAGSFEGFAISAKAPSSIVNSGQLSVEPGNQIQLVGGLIVNTGSISTPGGEITIQSVETSEETDGFVQVSKAGNLLSVGIGNESRTDAVNGGVEPVRPQTLAEILSNTSIRDATGILVDEEGAIKLIRSGRVIPTNSGETIIAGQLDVSNLSSGSGGTINLRGNQLELIDVQIEASGTEGEENSRTVAIESANSTASIEYTDFSSNAIISATVKEGFFNEENNLTIAGDQLTLGDLRSNITNVTLLSESGDLVINDVQTRNTIIESLTGNIEAGNISGGSLNLVALNGNITVETVSSGGSAGTSIRTGGFFRAIGTLPAPMPSSSDIDVETESYDLEDGQITPNNSIEPKRFSIQYAFESPLVIEHGADSFDIGVGDSDDLSQDSVSSFTSGAIVSVESGSQSNNDNVTPQRNRVLTGAGATILSDSSLKITSGFSPPEPINSIPPFESSSSAAAPSPSSDTTYDVERSYTALTCNIIATRESNTTSRSPISERLCISNNQEDNLLEISPDFSGQSKLKDSMSHGLLF